MASYLQAKADHVKGLWYLRIDDIDPPREVAGASADIIRSLAEHGFVHDDAIQYQSTHTKRYANAITLLAQAGRLYGCACTRKKLREQGSAVYPGSCRNQHLSLEGNTVRFILTDDHITFTDQILGPYAQSPLDVVGDFIVRRKNGLYSYQLATVVDDVTDNITEVVRGADLLDNTPRQISLVEALGYKPPSYLHVPIAINKSGQKLSKQTRAKTLEQRPVAENLFAAWHFLGQDRLHESAKPAQYMTPQSFWQRAFKQWDKTRIPNVQHQVADPEFL